MGVINLNYRGTFELKRAFEVVLRGVFADPTIIKDKRYRYDSQEKISKIRIYRSFPTRVEHYPAITISAGAHDASLTALGNQKEEASERIEGGVLKSQTYTGHTVVPIVLTVHTKESQQDRDLIRDILIQILRILAAPLFSNYGIGYSTIAVGADEQELDDDGKVLYTGTVTIDVNTDYTQVIDVDPESDQLINNIVVDVLGREFKDSEPVPLHEEPPFS